MPFTKEADFEQALIDILATKGWEKEVLRSPTEKDLLKNWANILFENNRNIDRLNEYPLTDSEMQQIIEQITALRTPLKLNGFINGKTVAITRDNPDDTAHFGKEVSLKIYDRREIAAGQSRYQVVQQPRFNARSEMLNARRGDLMLLINGMPVIHIELKKSGVDISHACHQIEKYSREGVFSGIFSLVQIFVAMVPEETVYFANPGPDGRFNKDYFFHWADYNNEPINDWKDVVASKYSLLSIPMAHQLIGFYTVADNADGILKVMRSYQYYAANAISDKVSKTVWQAPDNRGGYIWHTTGSGKTMTSFKSAQLIANSKDADKVVFLMDRIELGTQSLHEYRNFAEENEDVQATEDTGVLVTKLKSPNPADTLIVTSIQKMSNIQAEEGGLNAHDIDRIRSKRIVFIIDECHRSTFGTMLATIKETFSGAIFFGFTGTPIHDENSRKLNTTTSVFGNELHRYSIADGIRDKNVLGFDPYKVMTYKDSDLRHAVALEKAKAHDLAEVQADAGKSEIYYRYLNDITMAGFDDQNGKYVKGIEDYLSKVQYERREHQDAVVEDIVTNWDKQSRGGKFHALFATSSISEAIGYYRLIKEKNPALKITALFDPKIDNNEGFEYKEEGLVEILGDYNARYGQNFTIPTHAKFKKDVAARLAHKAPHTRIASDGEMQLDLVIVVDQMLTGFDSKWINTLYLDKLLQYENIIQAFSRTNRLFGPDKPFGTIRYYRKPHTMEQHIEKAVKLYSGDKPLGLFVERLHENLKKMNTVYEEITELYTSAGIEDFTTIPEEPAVRGKFAKLYKEFNEHLEAAKIQGFSWEQDEYSFTPEEAGEELTIQTACDENDFLVLAMRYKEMAAPKSGGSTTIDDSAYEIDGYLTEINTGAIDTEYMNSRFDKYLKALQANLSEEELQLTLNELHKSFASLTQEEQKYANIFLHDVQSGDAKLESGKRFKDYIVEYQSNAKTRQIEQISECFGLDQEKLKALMSLRVQETTINEYGRFEDLCSSVNKDKAKQYFETVEGKAVLPFRVNMKTERFLKDFILEGGFELDEHTKLYKGGG